MIKKYKNHNGKGLLFETVMSYAITGSDLKGQRPQTSSSTRFIANISKRTTKMQDSGLSSTICTDYCSVFQNHLIFHYKLKDQAIRIIAG